MPENNILFLLFDPASLLVGVHRRQPGTSRAGGSRAGPTGRAEARRLKSEIGTSWGTEQGEATGDEGGGGPAGKGGCGPPELVVETVGLGRVLASCGMGVSTSRPRAGLGSGRWRVPIRCRFVFPKFWVGSTDPPRPGGGSASASLWYFPLWIVL